MSDLPKGFCDQCRADFARLGAGLKACYCEHNQAGGLLLPMDGKERWRVYEPVTQAEFERALQRAETMLRAEQSTTIN